MWPALDPPQAADSPSNVHLFFVCTQKIYCYLEMYEMRLRMFHGKALG